MEREDYSECVGTDAKECRREIARKLEQKQTAILSKISAEIRSYRPVGKLTEFGEAMSVCGQIGEPKGKTCIGTPLGTFLFRNSSLPDKRVVDGWFADFKESEKLGSEVAEIYLVSFQPRMNTWTGNFKVVEQGRKFKQKGLLTPDEIKVLSVLEQFWASHPELDKQTGGGYWRSPTYIEPESPGKIRRRAKMVI